MKVFDDWLPDPRAYRADALTREFRSFEFPECTFHGIALDSLDGTVPSLIRAAFPGAAPALSFFRRSPEGQQEPHFIHTDADMGDWSAILYLNPKPPAKDGTAFWTHSTGAIESATAHERSAEGRTPEGWEVRHAVYGAFNRLLMFPSTFFHSRAIFDNWGDGDGARLTQVVFGTGHIL